MTLEYAQMESLLKEIKPQILNAKFINITAISSHKFIFHLENDKNLLVCFKEPFLRFHLTNYSFKEHPNFFCNELKLHLKGFKLKDCNLVNLDRVLQLTFENQGLIKTIICDFVPKKANCYLLDENKTILFSLVFAKDKQYLFPEKISFLKNLPEILLNHEIDKEYFNRESIAGFEEKKRDVKDDLKKQLKTLERHEIKVKEDYKLANQWEEIQHQANLIQANLFAIPTGSTSFTVFDWKKEHTVDLPLDSKVKPTEVIENLFQKSKKLKKALPHLEIQLEKNIKQKEKTDRLLTILESIENERDLKDFCQKNYLKYDVKEQKAKNKKVEPTLPFREYLTCTKHKIWVGKSAKDNDILTFKYANGSDYWLHVNGVPGSHVVIRLEKNKLLDEESLKDGLQLALHFSKAKNAKEAEVCVTLCKHVSRFGKNQPGKVQVSNVKNYYVKEDKERLNKIIQFKRV